MDAKVQAIHGAIAKYEAVRARRTSTPTRQDCAASAHGLAEYAGIDGGERQCSWCQRGRGVLSKIDADDPSSCPIEE